MLHPLQAVLSALKPVLAICMAFHCACTSSAVGYSPKASACQELPQCLGGGWGIAAKIHAASSCFAGQTSLLGGGRQALAQRSGVPSPSWQGVFLVFRRRQFRAARARRALLILLLRPADCRSSRAFLLQQFLRPVPPPVPSPLAAKGTRASGARRLLPHRLIGLPWLFICNYSGLAFSIAEGNKCFDSARYSPIAALASRCRTRALPAPAWSRSACACHSLPEAGKGCAYAS